jgi:threonine dehydrogenase-like Zn-dependent dehydrogenase
VDEISIVGSRCGDVADAIRVLAEKHIDVRPLISASFALSEGKKAFEEAQKKESLKVLLWNR